VGRHCPTAPRPSTGNPGPLATSRRCFPCLACRALPSRHTVSAVSPWTSRQPAPERAPAAASHPLPAGPCPPSQEQRCATPTAAMLVGESRRIPACPIEPCRHCWPRLHPRPHVNGRVGELRSIKRNREIEDARAGQTWQVGQPTACEEEARACSARASPFASPSRSSDIVAAAPRGRRGGRTSRPHPRSPARPTHAPVGWRGVRMRAPASCLLSVGVSVCLCLGVSVFVCVCVSAFVCLAVFVSLCLCGSEGLCVCVSVCLCVCVSACQRVCVWCLEVCVSLWFAGACGCMCASVSVWLAGCLSVCLSVCLSACLRVCLSACLRVAACVRACVRVCVAPSILPPGKICIGRTAFSLSDFEFLFYDTSFFPPAIPLGSSGAPPDTLIFRTESSLHALVCIDRL
jgi:hypothetical protein